MLNAGIIGVGTIGQMHAQCMEALDDVALKMVWDIDAERGKAFAKKHNVVFTKNCDEIMENPDIDVIYICTPTPCHRGDALKAIAAGKHVFVEKPLARTLDDGKAIIDAAKKSNKKFGVGHVVRFFPEYVMTKKMIEAGKIGNPAVARASRCSLMPGGKSWFSNTEMSGGSQFDAAVHDYDFLRWCFGDVERVLSRTFRRRDELIADYSLIVLRFKSGVIAHVESSWAEPDGFYYTLEVAGSGGIIDFDSRKGAPLSINKRASQSAVSSYVPMSPLKENPYLVQMRHFIDCLVNDKEPLVGPEDALKAIEIACACEVSSKTGQPVEIC